jgi:DNA polymerase-1
MSLEDAKKAHSTFFRTYAGVGSFHQKQKALKRSPKVYYHHNHKKGFYTSHWICTETLSGRKRIWGEREDGYSLATINQLYNSPSQGTGADILKAVMAEVYSSLPEDVKLIGSVHDELILEAPDAQAPEAAKMLLDIMRRIGSEMLSPVPVEAEVEVLESWGDG